MILVTGSHGLVGTGLARALERADRPIRRFDLADPAAAGDTRDPESVRAAVHGVRGVVHLAAVSRVVWGERDPDGCWRTNVEGTRNVLDACAAQRSPPWVLFASSREVYGQPATLPASEEAPLRPVNVYGRTKAAGEELVFSARSRGVLTAVVRLSNVYGSARDHADRVVPAFARAAVTGAELRVDGGGHTFDFTHIDDVVDGLLRMTGRLDAGDELPPIHLLTGRPTTLGELARLAVDLAGTESPLRDAEPRSFDVSHFTGDPSRAADLLGGWRATVTVREGLTRLIHDLREVAR